MTSASNRRSFLTQSLAAAAIAASPASAANRIQRQNGTRMRLALNAYSFNKPLMDGTMTLFDVVEFCAKNRVDALDATGYYFPGYPKVPPDEYLYKLKRMGFVNGVTITGTGVRNDFSVADAQARKNDIQMVKNWVDAASKMGATVVRVFSGKSVPEGSTFEKVLDYMVPAFKECAEYGRSRGVIVGLQHHDDFLKTAAETIRVIEAVDSEWFGCIVDVGSVRQGDPYVEIEKLVPYAVSWQIKESVYFNNSKTATPVDLHKIRMAIERVGYRGPLPFEALRPGDPKVGIVEFLEQVRKEFSL
jgi:sugar phosphate isomerase/epimerase